eukprot:XP_001700074.1 predicted protein [Chlamydomonas reinhardtii]
MREFKRSWACCYSNAPREVGLPYRAASRAAVGGNAELEQAHTALGALGAICRRFPARVGLCRDAPATPRFDHSMVAVDDKVYVYGGRRSGSAFTGILAGDSVDVMDVRTLSVMQAVGRVALQPDTAVLERPAAAAQARWVLLGGRILMHGGVQGPLGSAKVSRRTHTLDLVRRQVAWLDISSKPPYYESGIQVCVSYSLTINTTATTANAAALLLAAADTAAAGVVDQHLVFLGLMDAFSGQEPEFSVMYRASVARQDITYTCRVPRSGAPSAADANCFIVSAAAEKQLPSRRDLYGAAGLMYIYEGNTTEYDFTLTTDLVLLYGGQIATGASPRRQLHTARALQQASQPNGAGAGAGVDTGAMTAAQPPAQPPPPAPSAPTPFLTNGSTAGTYIYGGAYVATWQPAAGPRISASLPPATAGYVFEAVRNANGSGDVHSPGPRSGAALVGAGNTEMLLFGGLSLDERGNVVLMNDVHYLRYTPNLDPGRVSTDPTLLSPVPEPCPPGERCGPTAATPSGSALSSSYYDMGGDGPFGTTNTGPNARADAAPFPTARALPPGYAYVVASTGKRARASTNSFCAVPLPCILYRWWYVDLGRATPVDYVALWSRADCCGSADTGYKDRNRDIEGGRGVADCGGALGRFVVVRKPYPDYLALCEIYLSGGLSYAGGRWIQSSDIYGLDLGQPTLVWTVQQASTTSSGSTRQDGTGSGAASQRAGGSSSAVADLVLVPTPGTVSVSTPGPTELLQAVAAMSDGDLLSVQAPRGHVVGVLVESASVVLQGLAVVGCSQAGVLVRRPVSASAALADEPSLTVTDSQFANNSGSGIVMEAGSLSLVNVMLSNNSRSGLLVRAGAVAGSQVLAMTGVLFVNNTASTGGGFSLQSLDQASALFTDLVLAGNAAARDGGGAELSNMRTAAFAFVGGRVEANSAAGTGGGISLSDCILPISFTGTAFAGNAAGGTGGGLAADLVRRLDLSRCRVSRNVAAGGAGGGLAADTSGSITVSRCRLVANAALQGGALAIMAAAAAPPPPQRQQAASAPTAASDAAPSSAPNSTTLPTAAGGSASAAASSDESLATDSTGINADAGGAMALLLSVELEVADCDFVSNTARSGGGLYAAWDTGVQPYGALTLRQRVSGGVEDSRVAVSVTSTPPVVSGQTQLLTEAGVGHFTDLKVRGTPGAYNISFRAAVRDRTLPPLVMQVRLRPCLLGEVRTLDNDKCIRCAAATFSLDPTNTSCDLCPNNADCPMAGQGRVLLPEDGYWHSSPYSPQVHYCPWSEACSYGNRSARLLAFQMALPRLPVINASSSLFRLPPEALAYLNSWALGGDWDAGVWVLRAFNATSGYSDIQCAPNYGGNLCGRCNKGYGRTDFGSCIKCQPAALNHFLYGLKIGLTVFMIFISVYSIQTDLREVRQLWTLQRLNESMLQDNKDGKDSGLDDAHSKDNTHRTDTRTEPQHRRAAGAAGGGPDGGTAGYAFAARLARGTSAAGVEVNASGWVGEMVAPDGEPRAAATAAMAGGQLAALGGGGGVAARVHTGSGERLQLLPRGLGAVLAETRAAGMLQRAYSAGRVEPSTSGGMDAATGHGATAGSVYGAVRLVGGADAGLEVRAADAAGVAAAAGALEDPGCPIRHLPRSLELGAAEWAAAAEEDGAGPAPPSSDSSTGRGLPRRGSSTNAMRPGTPTFSRSYTGTHTPLTTQQSLTPDSCPDTETAVAAGAPGAVAAVARAAGGGGGIGNLASLSTGASLLADGPSIGDQSFASSTAAAARRKRPAAQIYGVLLKGSADDKNETQASDTGGGHAYAAAGSRSTGGGAAALSSGRGPVIHNPGRHDGSSTSTGTTRTNSLVAPVLSITRKVSLQWPAAVREFLAVTNSLSYSVSSFISLDCSLDHTSAVPVSVQRTIISLSVPLMLALLAWLLWTALYFRLKARKAVVPSYGRYMNTRFVITLIVITFYCYPGVTDMLLSIFSCPRLDTGGAATPYGAAARAVGTFWAEDYDLECFKGVHNFLAMALALPLVVVFSLGVPAASALFLWYNRDRLENDPAFAAKYGFVFGEYRPQYFYWESIIMLRKLVMVVVIVYVGYIGVGVQVLVALGVLMLATVMQLLCRPFREPAMNDLERLSLYSTCSTLYLSLFLYVEGVSEAGRIVLSCMLLGGNSLVAAFFTYCLGREVRRHTIAEYDMDGDGRLSWAEWETKLGENWFGHGVLGLARAVRAGVHLARRVLGRSVRSSARAVARVASGSVLDTGVED